jgi:signal transduction histidine kinase
VYPFKPMSPVRFVDPRFSLAAAIGWAVFAIAALSALLAATLAADIAERRGRADTERLLSQFATQIHHALGMNLDTRRSILQATAAQIVASSDRGNDALRRHLEAVSVQFPEFAWLGVTDDRGRVVAATGGTQQGEDVSEQLWFKQGLVRPFFGDVSTALLVESKRPPVTDQPPHFLDAAVPLTQISGTTVGVVGAHLSWAWIMQLQANLLHALDSHRDLSLLLAGADGTVLVGPSHWLGRKLDRSSETTEDGTYLVSRRAASLGGAWGVPWTIVVRQRADSALALARRTQRGVFLVVMLAGLLAAGSAVLVTRRLTRRLSTLAEDAQAVRRGEQPTLAQPSGSDEVSRIGTTLAELVGHLQEEKQALMTLNSDLDSRVAERTARIERMAEESRHAAVTRERLRLARELHDTLAHSLMALLTQIRVIRKLRHHFDAAELDVELGRAEEVAASGLSEARSAIVQMRHNGVRDVGLGAALKELLSRFGERTGVAFKFRADPVLAGLADERAETVVRMVEEALHNVENHAQAKTVSVVLRRAEGPAVGDPSLGMNTGDRVLVEIFDDGVGFDPSFSRPGHYGLRGIEEQAALIKANLVLHSQPGQGTRITLEFDL